MQREPGKLSGPLEETPFPEQLLGRVVTPGAAPRLHGYDVERDIAVHYGQAELVLLALTGELPDSRAAVLFEVACAFLSPISVAHAPAHAAVLSRLCGTTTSATIGTAAIALGEEARAAAGALAGVDRAAHAATKLRVRERAIAGVRAGIERIAGGNEQW